jgi:LPXTG-motif cell wall-anchored protein
VDWLRTFKSAFTTFTGGRTQTELMGIGLLVLAAAALAAYVVYKKKDLTA